MYQLEEINSRFERHWKTEEKQGVKGEKKKTLGTNMIQWGINNDKN